MMVSRLKHSNIINFLHIGLTDGPVDNVVEVRRKVHLVGILDVEVDSMLDLRLHGLEKCLGDQFNNYRFSRWWWRLGTCLWFKERAFMLVDRSIPWTSTPYLQGRNVNFKLIFSLSSLSSHEEGGTPSPGADVEDLHAWLQV